MGKKRGGETLFTKGNHAGGSIRKRRRKKEKDHLLLRAEERGKKKILHLKRKGGGKFKSFLHAMAFGEGGGGLTFSSKKKERGKEKDYTSPHRLIENTEGREKKKN